MQLHLESVDHLLRLKTQTAMRVFHSGLFKASLVGI